MPPQASGDEEDEELAAMQRMYSSIGKDMGEESLQGLESKYGPAPTPGEPDTDAVAGVDESEGEAAPLDGEAPPDEMMEAGAADRAEAPPEAPPAGAGGLEGLEDVPPELLAQLLEEISKKGGE